MAGSTVIPTFRYRDAKTMVGWLCDVIGFTRRLVLEDGAGGVDHAQLTLGQGMIMLSSTREDAFGAFASTPYVVVADPDAVFTRALAAGAKSVYAPRDETYGGRGAGFRDPEGVTWVVGSYDPWAPDA
jgi:uncharacterized glyoxalase superfamily protein PhnB